MKRVAVCIPTYNRKEMIGKTIDSVISSSFSDFDIIVFDNCSTDGTVDFIENKYGNKVKVIVQKENIGMNGNVNLIFDMIRNTKDYKYFITLHDDNIITYDFLEKTITMLEKDDNIAFVGTAYDIINNDDKVISRFKYRKLNNTIIMSDIEYYLHRVNGFWCPWSGSVIRISKLGELRFLEKEHPYYADIMFFTYLAENNKVAYIPEYLFQYRTHDKSATDTLDYDIVYNELFNEIGFFSDFLEAHHFAQPVIDKYKSTKFVDILYFKIRRAKNIQELFASTYWFIFENDYFKLHQLQFFPYRVFFNKLIWH